MTSPITWKTELRKLGDLIPWSDNPRQIRDAQGKRLQTSLRKFGYSQLIEVEPDNMILDGHQRDNLMKIMDEFTADSLLEVRVSSRKFTDEERRQYILLKGQGATGEWNFDTLSGWDIPELKEWGGFTDETLGLSFNFEEPPDEDPGPQIDNAEELRIKWGLELGQTWKLGEHILFCGDSAIIDNSFYAECKTLVFDPEWNDKYQPIGGFDNILAFGDGPTISKSFLLFGNPVWLFAWDCVSCWYTPNRPLRRMKLCAWYGDVKKYNFDGWHYGDAGEPRDVWNTRGEYKFKPDPRGKHLADIFSQPITKLHAESEHNHSKPIDWITLLIANCTSGNVYDPFLGSGTTLIACERLSRKCRAIEINPDYCAVAIQRWVDMTGCTPELIEIQTLSNNG